MEEAAAEAIAPSRAAPGAALGAIGAARFMPTGFGIGEIARGEPSRDDDDDDDDDD